MPSETEAGPKENEGLPPQSEEAKAGNPGNLDSATVSPEVPVNFPKISRKMWEVFFDDERNEIWIGVKSRQTVRGMRRQGGPLEDIELCVDPLSLLLALDSAKTEAMTALYKDQQVLMEKTQRREALKGNGILDRLSAGLRGTVEAGKKLLIH